MDTVSCPFLFLSGTRTYMKNREIAREGEDGENRLIDEGRRAVGSE